MFSVDEEEESEPPIEPDAPPEPMDVDLEECPFQVGDRVVKISGVGYGLRGTVIFINEERTKIRVQEDTGPGGEYSVWRLQRFSNYTRADQ
jgi:transcription antitermination factor NusG